MGSSGEAIRRTEEEIRAEKAATLGRAGERLEAALAVVAEIRAALAQALDPAMESRLREDYARARSRALDARRVLLIQREAIGLRTHRVVDQRYPEPPPLPAVPTR
jgi:hypothetical protein